MPPRYAGGLNPPFHPQNHLQSYHPTQQQSFLPPPGHSNSQNNAISSPFSSIGQSAVNNFERGTPDTMMSGQLGFGRGSSVQNHQGYSEMGPMRDRPEDSRIRNVWKHNLKQEMETLRSLVDDYPFIAMDTEFPGIVARPIGQFTNKSDYHYQTLRCNVDFLKMIQLGIALFREDGSLPPSDHNARNGYASTSVTPYAWQFNFQFSLEEDMSANDSITMLSKAGIDFERHNKQGIDPHEFGALLISSGLVLDPEVHWLSFHSGYDFGYLMKTMICQALPGDEDNFHMRIKKFFPSLYDIKYMLKHAAARQQVNDNVPLSQEAAHIIKQMYTKSGLQDIADELGIARVGQAHQAGSDSLLTGQVYFEMKKKIFGGSIDETRYSGQVWGLNAQMPPILNNIAPRELNGATFYLLAPPAHPNRLQQVSLTISDLRPRSAISLTLVEAV
ncbi:Poly(A) ribonuclease pop2 [Cyphellophora attinorum]|uniref:poly(A)-specific ribonuclease n=1 Tax=Cyphellophora attinorum TaxID=1664694 RepID=A0A0N1HX18_9EURO|nr:Poly(A) ribonuclease pop2 [Phialophora attinorum]KPI42374.1 Poly(A) ribonuclease pop2 [Phialophora attinorum]